jgi:plastocyanin
MVRRGSSHGRLRPAVAAAVAALLIVPLALSAPAAGDEQAAPAVATSETATATPADPATAPPVSVAPAPAPSAGSASSVTVTRATASATKSVAIVDFEYEPSAVTIRTGDSVFWTNVGTAEEGHDVAFDAFESETLPTGGTYSHVFKAAGSFDYICSIHPKMKGTVTVLERSPGGSQNAGGSGESRGDGSGDDSGGGGSDPAAESSGTAGPTGVGSPSGSGSAGAAAGSASLPATGENLLPMTLVSLLLLGFGLGLRFLGGLRKGVAVDPPYRDWLPERPGSRG